MAGHGNSPIWDSWFIWSILVHLGLLNLTIQRAREGRRGSTRSRKNGNNGGQPGQTGQDNQQGNANGGGTGTKEKPKCTLCGGTHKNLMFCPKLPQYLPYGNNQVPHPASLCLKFLGT